MNYELRITNWLVGFCVQDDKQESGFTLIELIVYMGLFTILITAMSIVFLSLLDQQSESESISAADQNGRYILARLANDIQRAQSVAIPATYGGQSSSLQISINSINYTYSLSGNNLQLTRSDGIGPDNLNGYDAVISNLNFQRLGQAGGRDSVQVSFTVSSLTTRHTISETRTYQTTAGLRCTVSGC